MNNDATTVLQTIITKLQTDHHDVPADVLLAVLAELSARIIAWSFPRQTQREMIAAMGEAIATSLGAARRRMVQ